MPEIIYPITLDYVPDWGAWEVVRELATNALDADPGFTLELQEVCDPDLDDVVKTLVITSKGYLVDRHLLLGVSEKESENSIGQFGEGMKLAMLVLTRMSLTADIYSNGWHYWNMPAEMNGEKVFKIIWEECDGSRDLTAIHIPHWEYDTYEERFVRPGDPRILFTDPFGRMVLEESGDPQIYVKGVWVQRGRAYSTDFAFSYNVTDVKMNRDRGVIDSWDLTRETGKIWASVTDTDLLTRFWQAADDRLGERHVRLSVAPIESKRAHKAAIRRVHGRNAVVKTDDAAAKQAKYRGAKPIETGSDLSSVAKDLIGSDVEHIQEIEGKSKVVITAKSLSERQTSTMQMLKRMAKRTGFEGRIQAYVLPQGVLAEYHKGNVRISVQELEHEKQALKAMLHEIGHDGGAEDETTEHTQAALDAAVDIILSYARR